MLLTIIIVPCTTEFAVRLADGSDDAGRVEVFYDNVWGSVCMNTWDNDASSVVCQQLGFTGASVAIYDGSFGGSDGQIWVSSVTNWHW